ncbi:MAG: hypothetical protein Q8S84_07785 [bacterium]|nr:hypothetical protein [bacterium]MDP3381339.1 hypothetical protein [bacterium]
MKRLKKIVAKISIVAILLNTTLAAIALETQYNFDNNNTSNVYAFN